MVTGPAVPSVTSTVIVVVPYASGTGVIVSVRSVPLTLTTRPVGATIPGSDEEAVTVSTSPGSASATCTGTASGTSSSVACGPIGAIVGASFTGRTVSWNPVETGGAVPSSTVTVIVVTPDAFATGVIVSVRSVPLPLTTRPVAAVTAVSDDAAVTVSTSAGSASATCTATASGTSSSVAWGPIGAIVGASFTGFTVTMKERSLQSSAVSVARTVIDAWPYASGSGVTEMIQGSVGEIDA